MILLNEVGLLSFLIPEFGKIVGHMQIDNIHKYTVDEHTFKAIEFISEYERKDKVNNEKLYSDVFGEIISKKILYISIFFHDLGKGLGKNHSISSGKILKKYSILLKLNPAETNTILWLIKNHLIMNKVSQHLDLEDPKTIYEFIKKVNSLEQLKLLFFFTMIDMKATSNKIWNNWNKYLLEQLFVKSRSFLLGKTSSLLNDLESIKFSLKRDLNKFSRKSTLDLINILPDDLIFVNDKKNLLHFLKIIKNYKDKPIIKIKKNLEKNATEIIVYTKDQPGLMSVLSGVVALCGFNVIEARVYTLKNSMALDTLWVQNINGLILDKKFDIPKLRKKLNEKIKAGKLTGNKFKFIRKENYKENLFKVKSAIYFDNEMSEKNTILEVNSLDRIGLIYDLTKKLYRLGLQINSAKILSLGAGATNIFYIQDKNGKKIFSINKLNFLKKKISPLIKN